jgi:hypothetical protein
MSRVEFKPTIPAFELMKIFHVSDSAASVVIYVFEHNSWRLFFLIPLLILRSAVNARHRGSHIF